MVDSYSVKVLILYSITDSGFHIKSIVIFYQSSLIVFSETFKKN